MMVRHYLKGHVYTSYCIYMRHFEHSGPSCRMYVGVRAKTKRVDARVFKCSDCPSFHTEEGPQFFVTLGIVRRLKPMKAIISYLKLRYF